MSRFEGYNSNDANNSGDLIPKIAESVMSWKYKEYEKRTFDTIQGRTVLLTFICMSSQRKMNLLTYMFHSVRSLRTLADILNTFFAVHTKLISYSKICNDSNALYEQFVQDDDRMLDPDTLEETLGDTKEWFKNLDDAEQMNILTSLMRLSGGNVIKRMYIRMIKIFNKRNVEGKQEFKEYKSETSMLFGENVNPILLSDVQPKYAYQEDEDGYDPDHPTTLKVVEARKQWQANMAKMRREIESDLQILNQQNLQTKQETKKDKSATPPKKEKKDKKDSGKKNKANVVDSTYDWLQLLPLWNVKKIFSYLDDSTLHNLKKVNNYWATLSKEVLEEKKTRDHLNSVIKKSQQFLETLLDMPLETSKMEIPKDNIVSEPSGFWKIMEKQRRTGTFIRRKKEELKKLQNVSALGQCMKEFYTSDIPFLNELQSFPTNLEIGDQYDSFESSSESFTGVMTLDDMNSKFTEEKLLVDSDEEKSSASSTLSQVVPSIVVSSESMQTW